MERSSVIDLLGSNICCMRLFLGVKVPKVFSLSVNHDGGSPALRLLGFCKATSQSVLGVYGCRGVAKVHRPVVGSVPVDVVNQGRTVPIMQKESHPMHVDQFFPVLEHKVPAFIGGSDGFFGLSFAGNQTRTGVVQKTGKINIVHAVAPLKQWFEKWRLSVGSTGPLRHYKGT